MRDLGRRVFVGLQLNLLCLCFAIITQPFGPVFTVFFSPLSLYDLCAITIFMLILCITHHISEHIE